MDDTQDGVGEHVQGHRDNHTHQQRITHCSVLRTRALWLVQGLNVLVEGARWNGWLTPLFILVPLLFIACQSVIPPDEATKTGVSFGTPILEPPARTTGDVRAMLAQRPLAQHAARTIQDITQLLDQYQPDPQLLARLRAALQEEPPAGDDPAVLARFYHAR